MGAGITSSGCCNCSGGGAGGTCGGCSLTAPTIAYQWTDGEITAGPPGGPPFVTVWFDSTLTWNPTIGQYQDIVMTPDPTTGMITPATIRMGCGGSPLGWFFTATQGTHIYSLGPRDTTGPFAYSCSPFHISQFNNPPVPGGVAGARV